MRKQFIDRGSRADAGVDREWLNLIELARVELTSEESGFPIESALTPDDGMGWRAADPGPQFIRLVFDEPQHIHCIRLVFQESEYTRTQEFVLRWSKDGNAYEELVRQQYNFAPPGNAREVEEYAVDLDGLTVLELDVVPDVARGGAKATLERMMLG